MCKPPLFHNWEAWCGSFPVFPWDYANVITNAQWSTALVFCITAIFPCQYMRSASFSKTGMSIGSAIYLAVIPLSYVSNDTPVNILFFITFNFILEYSWLTSNVVIVSVEQLWRVSAIHIHVSILSQMCLPSRLPCNIEQNSMNYTVGPCWLSI